jgi:chromate transporter
VGFVAALFFGLKAAVLAIVLQAVARLGRRVLKTPAMRALAVAAFVAIFFFDLALPIIVLGAGLLGLFASRAGFAGFDAATRHDAAADDSLLGDDAGSQPTRSSGATLRVAAIWLILWLAPVALLLATLGPQDVFSQIAVFFSKMAMVTFGGAYAVMAYVAQQAVDTYAWLTPREMLDGLGMAETTPGPLIMVLQFVGTIAAFRDPGSLSPLLAGVLGGLLATWVTFAPCFLWIFLGAPYVERLRGNRALSAALGAITAAVVGVILNLAIWFAIHAMFRQVQPWRGFGFSFDIPVWSSLDPWAAGLAAAAIVAVFGLRSGLLSTIAASAAAGLMLHVVGVLG